MQWLPKHTPEHTGKRVRTVIEELKSKGVTVFGATGFCYGGTILISCTCIVRGFSPLFSSPPRVRPCLRQPYPSGRR
jgi:dienelactone hydrolase